MPEEYTSLVTDLKSLTQGEEPNTETLKMAEDEWDTRPETVSYGIVSLDFEVPSFNAGNVKEDRGFEGSVDLFSMMRSGAGWVPLINEALTKHCGSCWTLNSHTYERNTGLFHWEWTFQVMG